MAGFGCTDCNEIFTYPATKMKVVRFSHGVPKETIETRNCPFCGSLKILRIEDVKVKEIKDVPMTKVSEANELLDKGFVVGGIYSGHVVLLKK